jgi:hypothetical protein
MLQLFHADVAKVDRDVAYIAMVVHVCCKCMLTMFHLCFRMYVASVFYLNVAYFSYICCKCFIWILRMFCNGFECFSRCLFANISEACFKYFICLQTYVVTVASQYFKSTSGVVSLSSLFYCLTLVSSPPPGAGWASTTSYSSSRCWWRWRRHGKLAPEADGKGAGSPCEACACRKRRGVGRKRDGARVSGLGDAEAGAGSYVRVDTREWSSRHRHPDASKALFRWENFYNLILFNKYFNINRSIKYFASGSPFGRDQIT